MQAGERKENEMKIINGLYKFESPAEEWEFMFRQGEKRFGSECKHEHSVGGICKNCLRKVIVK